MDFVSFGRNATLTDPILFDTTQKVFTALAAVPAVGVWVLIYRFSPKKNFQLNNPYERMQWFYALMSGIMVGQLLGHALPNATLYSDTNVPFLAAIFGIFAVIAFLKLCRVFGYAKNQVIGSTQYEPIEMYTENGEETKYTVLNEQEFILDGDTITHDTSSVQDENPIMSAATSTLTANDAHDVRWIRRRMFEILYITSCVMILFEGPYLSYNASGVIPGYAIPAFYAMKMIQGLMLACYSVFAYNHKRTRKFLFLTYYGWTTLVFGIVCVLSTLPVMLNLPSDVIAIFVESRIFGAFYEFFAGALAAVAFNFISREEYEPTKKGELTWLALFGVGAFIIWALGLVI